MQVDPLKLLQATTDVDALEHAVDEILKPKDVVETTQERKDSRLSLLDQQSVEMLKSIRSSKSPSIEV